MLKLNLRLGLCLAYAQFLGLFQPGYTYRVYAYKKKSMYYIFCNPSSIYIIHAFKIYIQRRSSEFFEKWLKV